MLHSAPIETVEKNIHILSCNKPRDATPVVFARKDRGWETRQDMKPRVLFPLSVVTKKTSLRKNAAYKVRVPRSVVSKFINGVPSISYS